MACYIYIARGALYVYRLRRSMGPLGYKDRECVCVCVCVCCYVDMYVCVYNVQTSVTFVCGS